MSLPAFDAALAWMASTASSGQQLELTFDGGEPMLAGKDWYCHALPALRRQFGECLWLGVQSNLWLLSDEFCELFHEYRVSLSTSLDGPEQINDLQRGAGHYARTMVGLETAHRHGLDVGVICTFTSLSAPYYREIFDFFAAHGLSFSVHEAVCTLGSDRGSDLALSPHAHADLFIAMFDYYFENITRMRISTFDQMVRGISAKQGELCTFSGCLGGYLTIAPDGGIFPCNRSTPHPEWRLGYVHEMPTSDDLTQTSTWQYLRHRELAMPEDCGGCAHFAYCKGGCAYNAITGGRDRRDPHCEAYKRIFTHITDRALEQVFSQENLQVVVKEGASSYGLLHKGHLLQVMRGGSHPQEVAGRARKAVAAVALAVSPTPEEAVAKLDCVGLVTQRERALRSLVALQSELRAQTQVPGRAYIHVTYACNLICNHCYLHSAPDTRSSQSEKVSRLDGFMPVEKVICLVRGLAQAGFCKASITGGEPIFYPQRDSLLAMLAELRSQVKPMQIVLRTNLTYALTPALVEKISHAADEIVVSVDGDAASHDARRGAGTYTRVTENLHLMLRTVQPGQIALAATLTAAQAHGREGQAVSALGQELGVAVRFRPLRPLGRAAALAIQIDSYVPWQEDAESFAYASIPRVTCGLGLKLPIEVNGDCYPCYALETPQDYLGNVFREGVAAVIESERYRALKQVTVDSNQQCRHCALRYLCGGFCRVWSANGDPDAPPKDCSALYKRAYSRLLAALEVLQVRPERWEAAGLPLFVSLLIS